MKRKIRIKKLPKAQNGLTGKALAAPNLMGDFEQQMTQQAAQYAANPLMLIQTPQYSENFKNNYVPPAIPQIGKTKYSTPSTPQLVTPGSGFNDIRNQEQTLREGEVATNVAPNIAELQTPEMQQQGMAALSDAAGGFDMNALSGLGNIPQGVGFVPFIQSGIFANLGNRVDEARRSADFKNRFLSDNMYASIPEGYSGNRGDYTLNQQIGLGFRPDEAVYGQFGKIAKYGGSMKRKIKITGLPQAAYGGTQNKASVDEMYPYNSNVRRAAYSDMLEGESQGEVRQYAEEVPREIANIEAEKGETIVKPNDQGLVNMYKIGGKRHSEGGTPLQADPNDFIFSDTKDMKIKDPAILESFGMQVQKKGRKGYTPAEISKKFNLNDPAMQRALNDPKADRIEKATAERMYDNNLSQLGKLALVQEARKGFPQGAPDISMPYMQKVGMDPSMFMPDVMTPQDATFEMGKAQKGTEIQPWEGGATVAGTYTPTGQLNKFSTRKQELGDYLSTWEDVIPNIKSMSEGEAQDAIYSWALENDPEAISSMWSKYGLTEKGLKDPKLKALTLDSKGRFSSETLKNKQNLEALKSGYVDKLFGARQLERRKQPPKPPVEPTPDPGPTPGKIIKEPQPADPGKYYIQDLMNTGLAVGDRLGLKKYLPYDTTLPQPVLMDPTFYDPSRELAATSEMANIGTRNLSQFTGPQSFNARFSGIQGNAAKDVANTLGRYNNLNVGVANQYEQANKSLINDFNIKNAMAKNDYFTKTVTANQQYDNAKRAADARLMRQATNTITNKAQTQVLNSMYPEFAIDPTVGGEMMYMPSQRTLDGSSVQSGNNIASTRKMFENDPDFNALSAKEKFDVLAKFMPRQSSTTRRYDPRDAFFYNMMRGRRRQG